jgi:hypothetical protein
MKINLKSINANKENVFNRIKEIIGKEPKIDHDTFIFEIENVFIWSKIKSMIDDYATMHEILIIIPE